MKQLGRVLVVGIGAVVVGATPAGAQQIVDASGENQRGGGGLAFVLFSIMCILMVASLFYMDKVRRRSAEREGSGTNP
jgi:hypothetical protein